MPARPLIGNPLRTVRIGTVKNSKNFFRVFGAARVIRVGTREDCGETTTSLESDIDHRAYAKRSPFYQS